MVLALAVLLLAGTSDMGTVLGGADVGPPVSTLWSTRMRPGEEIGIPTIDKHGTIFIATTGGEVAAIARDGTVLWDRKFENTPYVDTYLPDGRPTDLADAIPPGYDLSRIPDSIWHAGDAEDTDDSFTQQSPPLSPDGATLYVSGRRSGKMRALSTSDGHTIWEFDVRALPEVASDRLELGGGFRASPAIGADGTLYVPSGDWWGDQWEGAEELGIDWRKVTHRKYADHRLYALRPDGTLKWVFTLDRTDTERGMVGGTPAVVGNRIYFGSLNGFFYAVEDQGSRPVLIWRHEVIGGKQGHEEFWSAPAIASDGTIYIGNNDRKLYAFSPEGEVKWTYETGNEVYHRPIIGNDGAIYVGSEDNRFYAINPDGTLRWTSTLPEELGNGFWCVVNENGELIVLFGRTLTGLNPTNGELNWKYVIPSIADWEPSFTLDYDSRYIVYQGGIVRALRAASPLSTTSPWPKYAYSPANDGRMSSQTSAKSIAHAENQAGL